MAQLPQSLACIQFKMASNSILLRSISCCMSAASGDCCILARHEAVKAVNLAFSCKPFAAVVCE